MKKFFKRLYRIFTSYVPKNQEWVYGYYQGECVCGNIVKDYDEYCGICGIKLNWTDKHEPKHI